MVIAIEKNVDLCPVQITPFYVTWLHQSQEVLLLQGQRCKTEKQRVFVLTGISNQPDETWERVIPVAEENKVYLGCHLPGPPTPSGHRGLTRVLGARRGEGLRQFVKIVESPYHGFNFCVGSVAEGLEHPNEEVHDLIRTFGKQKKIFNIHLRNIIGKRDRFMEVYPDNGDIDFVRVVRTLAEVKYPYMIMPDHVPGHPDPASRHQAFAYGHIIALIQAANQA